MEKLQAVDQHDEQAMKLEIERSRAVSQLAGNMIANADTAIRLMRFQADCGMEMGGIVSTVPKPCPFCGKAPKVKYPDDDGGCTLLGMPVLRFDDVNDTTVTFELSDLLPMAMKAAGLELCV